MPSRTLSGRWVPLIQCAADSTKESEMSVPAQSNVIPKIMSKYPRAALTLAKMET